MTTRGTWRLAVGQMVDGDCWIIEMEKDVYRATPTSCAELHDNQVIGVVPALAHMNYKKGLDNANKLCGDKFESTWAPDVEWVVYGCIADEYSWNQGFTEEVCTVSRAHGAQASGEIPAPGAL
ncbi:hypothetical protein ACPYPG_20220 [Streptomyces sp. FR-108]|uniref:hypothetical protein n=1 Tax=Streptomyces sp. FR-108 TaxID=3416665 RepID=UPI003CFB5BA3